MDLTWLALTVRVFAIVAITCLVWSILQKLAEPQQIEKASRCIEADARDLEERRYKFLIGFLSVPDSARAFIGS